MVAGKMSTPLGRVLGLGAAKSGTEQFWRQRLTAVANVPLVLVLVLLRQFHERLRMQAR